MTEAKSSIDLTDTVWEEADEDTQARVRALCIEIDADPDDLSEGYNETTFELSRRKAKHGTSPKKAREMVALLHEALKLAGVAPFRREDMHRDTDKAEELRQLDACIVHATGERCRELCNEREAVQAWPTYHTIEAQLRANPESTELLNAGIHTVLNTLYFVSPDTDSDTNAADHRDTIREAFDGVEIQDRRTEYDTNSGEYQVLTDDEADTVWEEELQNYLDECVLPELPEQARMYFDEERWKRDAKMDGRGHSLNRYDGSELYQDDPETGETYYIYRQN